MLLNKSSQVSVLSQWTCQWTPSWRDWAIEKTTFPFNDSYDPQPRFLLPLTWGVWEANSQAPLFSHALFCPNQWHPWGRSALVAVKTHSQGDGDKPPWGLCPLLLVSIYFQHLCDAVFYLLPIALLWLVGHYLIFVREKKLCYRNQHTIFLNLERRYYGDWKYDQVSNINV